MIYFSWHAENKKCRNVVVSIFSLSLTNVLILYINRQRLFIHHPPPNPQKIKIQVWQYMFIINLHFGLWCDKGTDFLCFGLQDYELRKYDASAWVSDVTKGVDFQAAQTANFMKLFEYIQGNNVESKSWLTWISLWQEHCCSLVSIAWFQYMFGHVAQKCSFLSMGELLILPVCTFCICEVQLKSVKNFFFPGNLLSEEKLFYERAFVMTNNCKRNAWTMVWLKIEIFKFLLICLENFMSL